MRKKIVGICICMLVIATVLPAVGTPTELIEKQIVVLNEVRNENVYAAHEPEFDWEYLYGGPNDEVFRDIKQTTDGGYITVGVWNSTSHWLVKLDANGNEQWNSTALPNETYWPRCWTVEQTTDGGYITAGSHDNAGGTMSYNRCIWKVDENGTTDWLKIYNDPLNGYHMCIKQTTDGGYIVTGEVDITTTNHDILLFKTDSSGEVEWQHIWNLGNLDDCGWAVRQTSDGGYILIGKKQLTASNVDLLLMKTDSEGNILWNKTYGGITIDWSQSTDILFASDGGYYILGETNSFGAGYNDLWLIKTDANGNEQWNKTYGGKTYEMCGGICFTDDGNIMIAGTTNYGGINSNGVVIKIDVDGNILWQDTFGYAKNDQLQTIFPTNDGGCVIAGNIETTGSSGSGGYDGWVFKLKNFVNNPPDKPVKPSGKRRGASNTSYTYETSTSDPDGDQVFYRWDWGDGNLSAWLGPYNSSEVSKANHTWVNKGKYDIKVMPKDSYGREGNWSDPLPVTMPFSYTIPFHLFLQKLFERFPHAFPILRYLMGY